MLPLKPFTFYEPQNLSELKSLLATMDQHTKLMAGGTDLLPNLKHGLYDVNRIISLKKINELGSSSIDDKKLVLGALVKLADVAKNQEIKRLMPALAKASSQIASPQIRNMGTVGGNICLDTRCLYFNQTEFWRSSLGFCLKKDGCACHVVKTGKRCVAAASNDLATVLLAYDAQLTIEANHGSLVLRLDDFYSANGEKNNHLALGQVVTAVTVDLSSPSWGGFFKLRLRESIDFPLLSCAICFRLDGEGRLIHGILVINALVAKPKVMDLADYGGLLYNHALIESIAELAEKKSHPQTNIGTETAFRKHMVAYAVKQAFHDALPPSRES